MDQGKLGTIEVLGSKEVMESSSPIGSEKLARELLPLVPPG